LPIQSRLPFDESLWIWAVEKQIFVAQQKMKTMCRLAFVPRLHRQLVHGQCLPIGWRYSEVVVQVALPMWEVALQPPAPPEPLAGVVQIEAKT